ncbi:MAG: efflux RND transporter periplasmic adaptor subunit [Candidatus Aminicenantes bacterium]|nr:efflux RND transporter periplasmic adaptor subunit [Candidatus Aminicenantes bacterium]
MDRKIKKKKFTAKKIAMYGSALIFILVMIYLFAFKMTKSTLNVDRERLTISEVTRGPYQDYIPIMGEVLPITTYFLVADDGGRVEEIYMEAGVPIQKGQKILKLENTNLLMTIMWREAELYQQSNNLRNTRLQLEQYRLQLSQQMAEAESQLQQQKRTYDRYKKLHEDNLISDHNYELAKDQYEYLQERLELTRESQKNELTFRQQQIDQLEISLERMQNNLNVVYKKQENLTLRAPISGHLTALNAEIGQSKNPGERIGRIDVMDKFRVRADIDEYYIARVEKGRIGTFPFAGQDYKLQVRTVYLEVQDGKFQVDMYFVDEQPQGIRRGQTLHIRLELGDLKEALLLPRGGFFQTTGGNWVYVVDKSGKFAIKRNIRLGQYNSDVHEVLEGLEPGEKVITSSYESFGDMERLVFK